VLQQPYKTKSVQNHSLIFYSKMYFIFAGALVQPTAGSGEWARQ